MYEIFFADLGKATGIKDIGKRPVVIIGEQGRKVKVFKITSRNRDDCRHVRMNNYIINGFCDISQSFTIDKKFLLNYKRDCTGTEKALIEKAAAKKNKYYINKFNN